MRVPRESFAALTKFELGQIIVTPKALTVLHECGQTPETLLTRHQAGDWGDVSEEEKRFNEEGLVKRFNLVSIYWAPSGHKLMVFTKADRSVTLMHIDPR